MKRVEIFDKDRMSLMGKVSLWLSIRSVVGGLVRGRWLDLLSGFDSELQRNQIRNKNISEFVSLDCKLNKKLSSTGITIKQIMFDKKLPFRSDYFENITLVNGLEHVWNPQDILTESFRALKKGGVLQVVVPTWFGKQFLEFVAFKLQRKQEMIEMDDHKMYYDERDLWPTIIRAGFRPQNTTMKRIKFFCSLYVKATK